MDSSCSLVNKSCRYTSFVVFAVTMCSSPSSFVDARGFLFPPTNRKKDPRQRLDESFDPTICESVVKMFFSREPWRSCDVFNDSAFGRRTENNPREFLSSNPPPSPLLFFLEHRESIIRSWCCYSDLLISTSSGVTTKLFSTIVSLFAEFKYRSVKHDSWIFIELIYNIFPGKRLKFRTLNSLCVVFFPRKKEKKRGI